MHGLCAIVTKTNGCLNTTSKKRRSSTTKYNFFDQQYLWRVDDYTYMFWIIAVPPLIKHEFIFDIIWTPTECGRNDFYAMCTTKQLLIFCYQIDSMTINRVESITTRAPIYMYVEKHCINITKRMYLNVKTCVRKSPTSIRTIEIKLWILLLFIDAAGIEL